jgi:RimJ/RimL family protein N-acetyltransferase
MSGLAGAKLPDRATLEGRYARLEPIAASHVEDLFQASAGQDECFAYLFEQAPASATQMADWVARVSAGHDPLFFAVIDKASGRAGGRQSLMRITPAHGTIEIGGIYWGPGIARTRIATEAVFLHASYAFDVLGYRRFEWKCDNRNEPSKAAAQRFGFAFEGIFRQHMIVKGESRDTAWFAMLDSDWAKLKAGYERWLDPSNFDSDGAQKSKLRF